MRRLIESTLVSLDGVIESSDRSAPFAEGVRAVRHARAGQLRRVREGRVTYERLRANWASGTGSPYIERINAMPKDVASMSQEVVGWNATLLGSGVPAGIERLKAKPGKNLTKYGTSRRDDAPLKGKLVDEIRLWEMPVVVGSGQVFEGVDTSSLAVTLPDVRKLANDSAILTHAPG